MSDAALRTSRAPRDVMVWNRLSRVWIGALLLPVLVLGAFALRGTPEVVSGPGEAVAVAPRAPALRDVLAAQLEHNPRDGRAWVLLARLELETDRYAEAAAAYAKAVAASPKVANDPTVWCEYADALALAQGGRLAGPPRDFILRALALSPAHPRALEMAGGAAFEAHEYRTAATYWRELLPQIPERTRERGELAVAIARADELANRQ